MGKKRKVFTKEFKEDAVNYWQDRGRTALNLKWRKFARL